MKGSTRDGMVEECRSRSPAAAMQSLGAHRVCIRDVEAGAGMRSTETLCPDHTVFSSMSVQWRYLFLRCIILRIIPPDSIPTLFYTLTRHFLLLSSVMIAVVFLVGGNYTNWIPQLRHRGSHHLHPESPHTTPPSPCPPSPPSPKSSTPKRKTSK